MSRKSDSPKLTFFLSLSLLGLFGLGQLLFVATTLQRQWREKPGEIERVEVPVVVERLVPAAPAEPVIKKEASIDELIDRLDFDIQQAVIEATRPKPVQAKKAASARTRPQSQSGVLDQLSPQASQALKTARSLRHEGDLARALLTLEKLNQSHPNSAPILYELGLAYEDLRNTEAARQSYLAIFKLGSDAGGSYFLKASHKLQHGFGNPAAFRGKMGFDQVRPRMIKKPDGSRLLTLSIPIRLSPGTEIEPSDVLIDADFFDQVGQNDIVPSRGRIVREEWLHPPADWKSGEETLMIELDLPARNALEIEMDGTREYFGFFLKLFYQGEAMDAFAAPRSLVITRKKEGIEFFPMPDANFLDGGLLPEKDDISDFIDP